MGLVRQRARRVLACCIGLCVLAVGFQAYGLTRFGPRHSLSCNLALTTCAGAGFALALALRGRRALTWGAWIGLALFTAMAVIFAGETGRPAKLLGLLPWAVILHTHLTGRNRASTIYAGAVSLALAAFTIACWPDWSTAGSAIAAIGTAAIVGRRG